MVTAIRVEGVIPHTFDRLPTWARLGMSCRRQQILDDGTAVADLSVSLQAQISDPLWMMARQWQVGEFRGEDAASPVKISVTTHHAEIDRWSPGLDGDDIDRSADTPLEASVEGIAPQDMISAYRTAAEAGATLVDMVGAAGHGTFAEKLIETFPMPPLEGIDGDAALVALTRRSCDASAVLAHEDPVAGIGASGTIAPRIRKCIDAWRPHAEADLATVSNMPDCWDNKNLSYQAGLRTEAVSVTKPSVKLTAPDYPGGHLDWYAFDADPASGASARLSSQSDTFLPSPVRFRGMPHPRWWQLEEGDVYFGDVNSDPTDLARMLVGEFIATFGDDWYTIPVAVPAGALARIGVLKVTDTFGKTTIIKSSATIDLQTLGASRPWRMFELTGDANSAYGRPWLFVAPALAGSQEGPVLEQVDFARDEEANLAWGIERSVETDSGRPQDRDPEGDGQIMRGDPETVDPDKWRYRLTTRVPPQWTPLVPVATGDRAEHIFRRGRMRQWDIDADLQDSGPKGHLLTSDDILLINEAAIPRAGVSVSRRWQMARMPNGKIALWLARAKTYGHGSRSSGLIWDSLDVASS